jgi:hypothetical protein
MNALVTVQPQYAVTDLERMALAIAGSKLFGIQTPDQALALCLVAQAEGRHPASAAQDYHIIQGRPSKKSDAMLRDFLSAGGRVEWHALTDSQAHATFSHPAGGTVRIEWDMDRAKKAKLTTDMWSKYPRQMLRSRVVSEGVRTVYPMATSGMYVPEEVQDFEPQQQAIPAPQGDDDLVPQAQPRKSIAQARKDGDFERLTNAMRECKDEAALKAWGASAAEEVGSLPAGWQKDIRAEYVQMLAAFKADPMGVLIPYPDDDEAGAWSDWFDSILQAIGGAQSAAEVAEVQRANATGIVGATVALDDVPDRIARVAESRLAELDRQPS